jgi:hypothetical protein
MSNLMNNIFGPLDKKACVYFLILSGVFFVFLVFAIFGNAYVILKDMKNLTLGNIMGGMLMIFNIFVIYFVNRLLYTMCVKSLV